jgi:pSer/pThr/pTyr-binding forkhead associated (FHA) protein
MQQGQTKMSTFTGRLNQLEAQLQNFIEKKLARLSPLRGDEDNLARRLVASMRAGAISTGDGILLAPDRFTVLAHPAQTRELDSDLEMLVELAYLLQEIGKEANLHFSQPPVVSIAPNIAVPINQVEVIARFSEGALGKTANLTESSNAEESSIPPNAFLIVNGTEILPLDQPVINIGRRSSNQLVIDDPRVSRDHAQIRATRGHYEIFDLDSTGGTFVNRQRITQWTLHPGDVISLAGVPVIYGQEMTKAAGHTQKLSTASGTNQPATQNDPA